MDMNLTGKQHGNFEWDMGWSPAFNRFEAAFGSENQTTGASALPRPAFGSDNGGGDASVMRQLQESPVINDTILRPAAHTPSPPRARQTLLLQLSDGPDGQLYPTRRPSELLSVPGDFDGITMSLNGCAIFGPLHRILCHPIFGPLYCVFALPFQVFLIFFGKFHLCEVVLPYPGTLVGSVGVLDDFGVYPNSRCWCVP